MEAKRVRVVDRGQRRPQQDATGVRVHPPNHNATPLISAP